MTLNGIEMIHQVIHDRSFSPLIKPSQVGSVERLLKRRDFFIFCFVRNPYTRLLSAYLDKIKNNKQEKQLIIMQLGMDPSRLDVEISFEQFVNAVCEQPINNMDPHWRVQYYQTHQETLRYDTIGRFENFERDLVRVLEKINSEYKKYWLKEDRHATYSSAQLNDYFTKDIMKTVYQKYRMDFEAFGYNKDTLPGL